VIDVELGPCFDRVFFTGYAAMTVSLFTSWLLRRKEELSPSRALFLTYTGLFLLAMGIALATLIRFVSCW